MRKNDRGYPSCGLKFTVFKNLKNSGPGDAFAPLPEVFSPAIWASF